jgi:hypothetical protein
MAEVIQMTHAQAAAAEGEYLLALPAIRATSDIDDSLIDALPWSEIEIISGYCIDRPWEMPAGSCVDEGAGSQQRCFTEAQVTWAASAA